MTSRSTPLTSTEEGGGVSGSEDAVSKKLHGIYLKYVKPLEEMYKYDVFRPSWFEETILNPRPFVTFFGPWSSGKTTFINYLLQNNYLWTGPQPTTANFTVVVHGKETGPLDGRVLANAKNLPFRGLNAFGEAFLPHFQGFQAPHPLLEKVTLIDTPGVLEGTEGLHERQYDYVKVCRWFVERSDLIFFLFDPTKLDAGKELRLMFTEALKGQEGKLRIILNKADAIDTQALMRVYGSLFWNLSNVVNTTEPPRVYVGSFWDQPYKEGAFTLLFSEEKMDLLHELIDVIPQQAHDKRVALLIRRAKDVLTHAAIVGGIKSDLPAIFFKDKAKKRALENLPRTYEVVAAKYKLNHKDFPPVSEYHQFLGKFDVEKFPDIAKAEKRGLIAAIRECIDTLLPGMLRPVKNYGPSNPHNTADVDGLKQRYYDAVRGQYEGKAGIQGSTDIVAPASRSALAPAPAQSASLPMPSPPPQSSSSSTQFDTAGMAQLQAVHAQMLLAERGQQQQRPQPGLPAAAATVVHERQPFGEEAHTPENAGGAPDEGADSEPATVVAHGRNSSTNGEQHLPSTAAGATGGVGFASIQTPSKR